ncbi:MAG: hypothetical protein WCJ97_01630 [Phycisphaerae bacterium]
MNMNNLLFSRILQVLCLGLVLLLTAGQLCAQDLVTGRVISVGLSGVNDSGGVMRAGQWVPVQLELVNRSGRSLACQLAIDATDGDGDQLRNFSRKLVLEPSSQPRVVWTYYWPGSSEDGSGPKSVTVWDEGQREILGRIIRAPSASRQSEVLDPGDYQDARHNHWVLVLSDGGAAGMSGFRDSQGGGERVRLNVLNRADMLPDHYLGLEGVDTVVWRADAEGLRLGDIPQEFQLRALLEWVKRGGHLVILTAQQTPDFSAATDALLQQALPVQFIGTRELPNLGALGTASGMPLLRLDKTTGTFIQALVKPKPEALVIGLNGWDRNQPLAVRGNFGQGFVTVVTMDLGLNSIEQADRITNNVLMLHLWPQLLGWPGEFVNATQYKIFEATHKDAINAPQRVNLDEDLPASVDLSRQTSIRIVASLLFLGVYWIVAGPGSFLVLRMTKRIKWSWWIFGATVVVASGFAVLAVNLLRLEQVEVRHMTYLAGRSDSPDVRGTALVSIYAPINGKVRVQMAEECQGYITPLSNPFTLANAGFADPQQYSQDNDKTGQIDVPLRSTVKKLQASWLAPSGVKIDGHLTQGRGGVEGWLENRTGMVLRDVQVICGWDTPRPVALQIRDLNKSWAANQRLQLDTFAPRSMSAQPKASYLTLDRLLTVVGLRMNNGSTLHALEQNLPDLDEASKYIFTQQPAPHLLMGALAVWRTPDPVLEKKRVALTRHWIRSLDQSGQVFSRRVVVVAQAESPLPWKLKVNGTEQSGQGTTVVYWSLPVLAE